MRERPAVLAQAEQEIRVQHRVGALTVDVHVTLRKPWTILFGPSGSGKTTLLRSIAGLLRPESARIASTTGAGPSSARTVVLIDTAAGIDMPAQRRAVRYAPQQPSLFPHMTVLQNVSYGMQRNAGDGGEKQRTERLLQTALRDFQLGDLAHKRPAHLSGGEAQRVNLARAWLAAGCQLLLLDEPFTGLDQRVRSNIIKTLIERSRETQILSVTHDVAEAFELEAEVIKLQEGKVVAQGPAPEVLAEERMHLLRHLGAGAFPLRSTEPFLGG